MPLTRNEVLAGALRLLDEEGFDSLTMRRLAKLLDVQAGAIYWHFANKQEMIDAMADQLMAGLLTPPVKGAWDRQLAELCRRLARGLTSHRDGARLATSALRPGTNGLEMSEALLRVAREAGLPKDERLWATSALGYYVLGYVTDVQALEAAKAHGLDSTFDAFKKQLDGKKYPELMGLSKRGLEQLMSGGAFRERFEFGLKVILEGLKVERRRIRAKR